MLASGEPPALFTRVEKGGVVRRLADGACGPPDYVRTWGPVGAARLKLPAHELPPGHLANHLIALNLGAESALEASVAGGDWEVRRLPSRGLVVWPAGLEYEARVRAPVDHLFVEVSPAFAADVLGPHEVSDLRPAVGAHDAFAEHVMLALAAEARAQTRNGATRVEKLASALFSHLAEASLVMEPAAAELPTLPSAKLRRVLEHVAAHLDAPLALQQLAVLAGMDVFRFGRAFKQSTGVSPHRYVLEARIGRAKVLLGERALSVTEVALATGFATPSHFSVTFRRLAGVTPRAWRDGQR
jgi:AraC family transcriptional regulator